MSRFRNIFNWFIILGKSLWKDSTDEAVTMAIPSECKMPDLSGLDSPLTNRLIVQLLVGQKDLSPNARLYCRNFVRLIDKALEEYNNAREVLLTQGKGIYVFAFANYMEDCINAIRRLYLLLDRIKSEKESPVLPREARRFLETRRESIANVRNDAEHIDELIRNGDIATGKPVMLALSKTKDGVVVADCEIKFKELALVLEKMNEIAQYILTIKKVDTQHSN